MKFRQWAIYSAVFVTLILFIAGVFQLILKIKYRSIKTILTALVIIALLAGIPYVGFLTIFTYAPEHVVIKNDIKLVAYVHGFMHTNVEYYDYKNFLVRSNKLRLYEDYGDGAYDPIAKPQANVHVKNYTWYDDDGNAIK